MIDFPGEKLEIFGCEKQLCLEVFGMSGKHSLKGIKIVCQRAWFTRYVHQITRAGCFVQGDLYGSLLHQGDHRGLQEVLSHGSLYYWGWSLRWLFLEGQGSGWGERRVLANQLI